jgi:hypothetical protein
VALWEIAGHWNIQEDYNIDEAFAVLEDDNVV